MKKKLKIIFKIILITITIFLFNVVNIVNTTQANDAIPSILKTLGECGDLLKYKGEKVEVYYVYYSSKAYNFPAYCIEITKQGINNEIRYAIIEQRYTQDDDLWKYIKNGFPYKTMQELGCETVKEAYMATQQAIYYYLYNYNIEDFEAIGEAGERTLNALKQIIKNAQSTNEKKPSNEFTIKALQEGFVIDSIDPNYASKTYEIVPESKIESYVVVPENEKDREIIKITNEKNEKTSYFEPNEKFKVLVPLEIIKKEETINFIVNVKVESMPLYEAIPENPAYQKYILTSLITESVSMSTEERCVEEKEEPKEEKENKKLVIAPIKKLPKTGM